MRFYSKIGLEIVLPIAIVMLFVIGMLLRSEGTWPVVLFLLLLNGFIAYLFTQTYYEINGHELKIKSGFLFNSRVDVNDIREIRETNNPLSSPAISLDRLEVRYGKNKYVLISPKDKKGFIDSIVSVNPSISIKYKKQPMQ
ncbi:MAG TPA: hypothetical protein DCQ34_04810 [Chitinophagaceae bacterium]|nr:hypothetical protein [Chitinophagaceae bacterium]HCY89960.1 hypothetical protein [Chitinophagaceae bacterium]HRF26062.1 PH domain-containing protein [Ferruginibacter sp.]